MKAGNQLTEQQCKQALSGTRYEVLEFGNAP